MVDYSEHDEPLYIVPQYFESVLIFHVVLTWQLLSYHLTHDLFRSMDTNR
jgi:hypothetical protein